MNEVAKVEEGRVPISPGLLERFHRLAPEVLAGRRGDYVIKQVGIAVEWIVLGLVPIVGMFAFGWKGGELLGFLVLGTWIGIFREVLRFILLARPLQRESERFEEERFVWSMCGALREGKSTMPRLGSDSKHNTLAGIFIDLLAGSVGTAMLFLMLGAKRPELLREALAGLSLEVKGSLAVIAAAQALSVLYEAIHFWFISDRTRVAGSQAGVRGPGLFLLLFLFLIIVVSMEKDARTLLLVVNGIFVLFGLVALVGIHLMRKEAAWLSEYLDRRRRGPMVDTI